MTAIGYVSGLTTIVLSIYYGMRIYLAIPVGIVTGWLGAYVIGKGFVAFSVWFEMKNTETDEEGD